MAKRNQNNAGIMVVAVLIVLAIAYIILPAILLLLSIFFFLQYIHSANRLGVIGKKIGIGDVERILYKETYQEIAKLIGQVNRLNQIGEDEGLSRNLDGGFSQRSNRGKELRAAIEELEAVISRHRMVLFNISIKPIEIWERLVLPFKRFYSLTVSLLFFLAVAFIISLAASIPYNTIVPVFGNIDIKIFNSFLFLLLASGLTFGIFKLAEWDSGRVFRSIHGPKPQIDITNIDAFSETKESDYKNDTQDDSTNYRSHEEDQEQKATESSIPNTELASALVIFGISDSDLNEDTLKSRYRKLQLEYHPDRVASLGIELRQFAEEKTKQINNAYNFLLNYVGATR